MTSDTLTGFMMLFMLVFLGFYFWFFYAFILKKDVQRQQIRRFHNAIKSIYGKSLKIDVAFLQLKLNMKKLC